MPFLEMAHNNGLTDIGPVFNFRLDFIMKSVATSGLVCPGPVNNFISKSSYYPQANSVLYCLEDMWYAMHTQEVKS